MPNIMITERCNLRCPYCFASEKLGDKDMGLPAFEKSLAFCVEGEPERSHIGIIGGEPTVHNDFDKILESVIRFGVGSVTVFTNGTNLMQYARLLSHRSIGLLVNFNDVNTMGSEAYNTMGKNILSYHRQYMAGNLGLGLNVYKAQAPQLDDLLEVAKLLRLKILRLSVSVPPQEYLSEHNILDYFRELKDTYLDICMRLDEHGIAVRQDCNYIPRCVFSQGEVEMLTDMSRKYSDKLQQRIEYISTTKCMPVIDILPDLTAVRCFGLSSMEAISIARFETVRELAGYFCNHLDNYLQCLHITPDCLNCRSLSIGCNMGCPRARVKGFQQYKEKWGCVECP